MRGPPPNFRSAAAGPIEWRPKRILRRLTRQRQRIADERGKKIDQALADLARWPIYPDPAPHGLPGFLLVSRTSRPARFPTLERTLKSLLDQSVCPDRLILWLAQEDAALLAEPVKALTGERFTVRTCADLRSFKKVLPALAAFPDHFIVTADDDVHYPGRWLETLVEAFDPDEPTIVSHRAHRITYTRDGRMAPYRRWLREVRDERSGRPQTDLLPTGNCGILYPPGALPPDTADLVLVDRLSATCDGSWLYFAWRRAGWAARTIRARLPIVDWPDAQSVALFRYYSGGSKDRYHQALAAHFGVP